ncbi:MAG: VWA domain-containing protein [Acetobacterales bacterium]
MSGRLAANVIHFARVLRAAGLPVGTGQALDAVRAVEQVGIEGRDDFYWTLHAVLVTRADQRALFDEAFALFWQTRRLISQLAQTHRGEEAEDGHDEGSRTSRRVAEALMPETVAERREDKVEVERDAALTWSERERLQAMDFEEMSAEELRRARDLVARMRLPIMVLPTRRLEPSTLGRAVDMRATLRASMRAGGDVIRLRRARRKRRRPPIVVLCDISGSMSRYSRMMLHFLHAVTGDRDRVHSFLFGTRLTNVTRHLRHRDVDHALARVAESVEDWSGGTRIGACLHDFNRHWSRRVLGQGALVLLITDGLDREAGDGLAAEMRRLHDSCRRLVWLNPLLRFEGFQPKSLGVRAMLPYVDDFRPVHSLDSLQALVDVLSRPAHHRPTFAPRRAA